MAVSVTICALTGLFTNVIHLNHLVSGPPEKRFPALNVDTNLDHQIPIEELCWATRGDVLEPQLSRVELEPDAQPRGHRRVERGLELCHGARGVLGDAVRVLEGHC